MDGALIEVVSRRQKPVSLVVRSLEFGRKRLEMIMVKIAYVMFVIVVITGDIWGNSRGGSLWQ